MPTTPHLAAPAAQPPASPSLAAALGALPRPAPTPHTLTARSRPPRTDPDGPRPDAFFALAPGVYSTVSHGRVVLLSVRANRYFALPRAATGAWRGLIAHGAGQAETPLSPRELALWRRLSAQKLAIAAAAPQAPPPAPPAPAHRSAQTDWVRYETRPRLDDARVFFAAYARAALRLRLQGLAGCVEHVRRARRRVTPRGGDLAAAALRFNTARILVSARLGACLLDSFAAFDFFAARGIATEVVIGVRPNPVLAHCWLEAEGAVLNDSVESVTRYTEILRA